MKSPTGIAGFDQMTAGGLPRGRITAIIGASGAGKTVFAMQTVLNILQTTDGVGVFVSFEQSAEAVVADLESFGWGAPKALAAGLLHVINAQPDRDVIMSGAFDISGLLAAIEASARGRPLACVVLDGIDALLSLLPTAAAQRQELTRIQDSIAQLGATALLTIKAGVATDGAFEDLALYLSDCVIELVRDTEDGVSTRSIRIQKYRGSGHMLSRQPFILTDRGIEVEGLDLDPTPIDVPEERLSSGVPRLDEMLAGGYFRGSSTLLSGAPGTAKTTLGMHFLSAMCARGEKALFVGFDETSGEAIRNMRSIGIDLAPHVESGRLRMHRVINRAAGPDEVSYEITSLIEKEQPRHLLIDPISIFSTATRSQNAVYRIIQLCKRRGITVILTSLLDTGVGELEATRSHISALCDTWIHLSYVISGGERNRALTIIKARGTPHSNQVAELVLGASGISVADVYTEDGAVLMGSLRWQRERANQEATRAAEALAAGHYREVERAADDIARQIAGLTSDLEDKRRELDGLRLRANTIQNAEEERRAAMARRRGPSKVVTAEA